MKLFYMALINDSSYNLRFGHIHLVWFGFVWVRYIEREKTVSNSFATSWFNVKILYAKATLTHINRIGKSKAPNC